MGEWKEYRLGDLADVQTGPFGSQLHQRDYKASGTPIITVEHLGENKILHQELPLVGDGDKERLSKYILHEGDIVFSRVGSVDRRGFVHQEEDGWLFSGRCLRVRANRDIVEPRFLSFYFGQESFKEHIRMIAVGATMPSINTEILSNVDISVPPLPEQRAIAAVLSSLDDKIDLLHRQNKTLEKLAETLFRQWFLQETKGWEEVTLRDIADHVKENINPSKYPTVLFLHYSVPSYDEGREPKKEIGKDILSNKFRVYSDSILISKLNPRFPRIWPVFGQIDETSSICSTEFQVVKPKDNNYFGFIYCYLKSPLVTQELESAVGGTSGSHQRVDPEVIFDLSFPKPPEEKIRRFGELTDDYWLKINENDRQIRTLTEMRNALLPKLMSGEVRVRE